MALPDPASPLACTGGDSGGESDPPAGPEGGAPAASSRRSASPFRKTTKNNRRKLKTLIETAKKLVKDMQQAYQDLGDERVIWSGEMFLAIAVGWPTCGFQPQIEILGTAGLQEEHLERVQLNLSRCARYAMLQAHALEVSMR